MKIEQTKVCETDNIGSIVVYRIIKEGKEIPVNTITPMCSKLAWNEHKLQYVPVQLYLSLWTYQKKTALKWIWHCTWQ